MLLKKNEGYKNDLIFYTLGCSNLESKIMKMNYRLADVQKIISDYASCTNSRMTYEKKVDKIKSEFGVFAGISSTKIKFENRTQMGAKLAQTNFPQSISFSVGINWRIYLSRNLNRFSLNNELMYSSYKTKGVNVEKPGSMTTVSTVTTFNLSYVKLNTLFQYSIPINASSSFFINGGVSNGTAMRITNNQRETTTYDATEIVKETSALQKTTKYEFGFLGGLGGQIKKYSLQARFEGGNGMTGNGNLKCRANRLFLLFGYAF